MATEVEPKAAGYAAALILTEPCAHVRMLFHRFERRHDPDRPVGRTVGRARALACRILETKLDRIDAELLGHQCERALNGESGHRRGRRPVGRDFRPVDDDLVADATDVFDVVTSPSRHRTDLSPDARESPAAVPQVRVCRNEAPVPGGSNLDIDRGRRRRS